MLWRLVWALVPSGVDFVVLGVMVSGGLAAVCHRMFDGAWGWADRAAGDGAAA
ncbi:hypothetical protein [Kribbella sp. NPDC051620]|uniref:hypothetical protein n=1 Tax=Kribbella sp. NPDC051620 TaxID=3364120 RepID=UPI0037B3A542